MIKRSLSAISTLLIAALLTLSVSAEYDKQLMFDLADLLTQEEEAELEKSAQSVSAAYELDVVLVTTSDAKGKNAQTFADYFCKENKFGYDKENGRCVLLLIDTDNGDICVSTAGGSDANIAELFDEETVESILGAVEQYSANKEYSSAFGEFINCAVQRLNQDEPSSNRNEEFDDFYDFDSDYYGGTLAPVVRPWYTHLSLIPAIIGVVVAVIVLLKMYSISGGSMTARGSGYEMKGKRKILAQRDTPVKAERPTPPDSDKTQ